MIFKIPDIKQQKPAILERGEANAGGGGTGERLSSAPVYCPGRVSSNKAGRGNLSGVPLQWGVAAEVQEGQGSQSSQDRVEEKGSYAEKTLWATEGVRGGVFSWILISTGPWGNCQCWQKPRKRSRGINPWNSHRIELVFSSHNGGKRIKCH